MDQNQTDIDDDQLNALLFTDSDDDVPKKPASDNKIQKQSSTAARTKASGSHISESAESKTKKQSQDAPESGDAVSNLDENLFGSLTGPKNVKPITTKEPKVTRKPKKRKNPSKHSKTKPTAVQEPVVTSGSTSRDEALRILAEEEKEAEKSLESLLDKPEKTQSTPVEDPLPRSKQEFPDFSSDDDFLSSLDDKPITSSAATTSMNIGPDAAKAQTVRVNNNIPTSNLDLALDDGNILSSVVKSRSASLSINLSENTETASTGQVQASSAQTNYPALTEAVAAYVPSTNTFQRAVPLSARAGRRARPSNPLKIGENISLKSTQNDPQPDALVPLEEREQLPRAELIINAESVALTSDTSTKRGTSATSNMNQSPSALESSASAVSTQSPLNLISEPLLNGNTTSGGISNSSVWDAVQPPANNITSSAYPIRGSISSHIQEAASIHQMAQLQADLTKAKRTIKELESEVEGLKIQLKTTAADYHEQLLAHTKANNDREIQIRIEEDRKLKAALEHFNVMHQSSATAKERLHNEALESLKRMHEMELASVKRQHSDEHQFISMTEAISRSAVTVEGIQKEVREEIARVDQQRRADADAREKLLIEREKKLQDDIKRHTNVIATLESLRREHDSERGRLHEEEVRLQSLQEFLMSESSSLKAQMANERAALQEEKRNLDRSIKDWKLEVAANQAEIAFLRDKAQAKINEANAAESAGQRAFAQAHQMVISEGEIIRRDREMALKLRAEAEQEKQRIDQTSATMVEQRRQLSARMADVQKLGEKIRAQSETVAMACRQTQTEIAECRRLKQEIEQEKLTIKSERASVEELRKFVEAERRRMESDRLDIVRQRQKVIIETRGPKASCKVSKRNDRETKEYKEETALQPLLTNENSMKPVKSAKESSENEIKSERNDLRLSVEQERELFHFRMKARVAADYAMSEKKIIRPI